MCSLYNIALRYSKIKYAHYVQLPNEIKVRSFRDEITGLELEIIETHKTHAVVTTQSTSPEFEMKAAYPRCLHK